ncbi:fibrinogen-related protein 3-2 [Plakobranchus ocellatus]|uniref:Fibrinogen-related protein 3-2 n=1 Tax=Plakobranchus ocellatus TaxID=259542 RepID=A0AAV4AZ90_9GAST|nr:fibrinogen-related protein 3-2 [Plakobranchus ocellatus]
MFSYGPNRDTVAAMGTIMQHLFLLAMVIVYTAAQGLEFFLDRQMQLSSTDDVCGQFTCRAKGNSVTIANITLTRISAARETTRLFTLTRENFEKRVRIDNILINGSLENKLAIIQVDMVNVSSCDSEYFVCQVTYLKQSGQIQSEFIMIGSGQFPNAQSVSEPASNPGSRQLSSTRSPYSYVSELLLLNEKVNNVESKFQSLSDRLDDKVRRNTETVLERTGSLENSVLQRVTSVETDISQRVSRLEDRLSNMMLDQPQQKSEYAESLADLEKRLAEVVVTVNKSIASVELRQENNGHDVPKSCERGMGNDVTKTYLPYVVLTHETLQKEILCDTHTDGGGWIVFQRRVSGDVDFYRDWTSYRNGFGSLSGDFWLGNEAVHRLTDKDAYELRIDFRNDGQDHFAQYSSFVIGDEASKYRLLVNSFKGTIFDAMKTHNNYAFTTFDRDNDVEKTFNCAIQDHGAWWYTSCYHSNLNGKWGVNADIGVSWYTGSAWLRPYYTEMKIRRVKSDRNA